MESQIKGLPAVPAQTAQGEPRSSWEQTLPSLKKENHMVKCRNCGGFGHNVRSRMCPMKQGHVLLVSQPLGARKEKENGDPCRPHGLQKLSQDTRQRFDEQQRKAPFQKFPMKPQKGDQQVNLAQPRMPSIPGIRKRSASPVKTSLGKQMCPGKPVLQCFDSSYILHSRQKEGRRMAVAGVAKLVLRQDGRNSASEELLDQKGTSCQHPVAVPKSNASSELFHKEPKAQGPSRKTQPSQHPVIHQNRQNPKLSFGAPGKEASWCPTQPSQNPLKKQRLNSTDAPEKSHARTGSKGTLDSQSPPIANRLGLKGANEMSKKITAQDPSTDQQQLYSRAALFATRPCIEFHRASAGRVADQALRMIFTRHGSNCWSSRFLSVPPPLPLEKQTPPSESPTFPEEGEVAGSQVKVSILYEDLQVSSSSSENSDGE
ncbi:protein FAM90A1 [Mus musculus]|uniref:Family with sequence similarity 90, member A1A n=1 Tax=Mus musculus TaxID=10090 RepID=A2A4E2_MOUSE|nr:protein FAM90A1 [Mus musculus]|eukprot:NP_001075131.1 protein FAM90A1 [Mus musculus]